MEKEGNKKKQTRARIKAVGAKHFMEHGYRETMIVDVAKEAGLDRRTIYRYYPSKETLLIEICSDFWREFIELFETVTFENCTSGYQKVKRQFDVFLELLRQSPDMIIFLGMIDTSVGQNLYNIEVYKELDSYGKRLDVRLTELIDEGQKDGSIKTWFTPREYALTISNSIVALATRIAIYLPNVLIQGEGFTWTLLMNQGKIFIESMENKE